MDFSRFIFFIGLISFCTLSITAQEESLDIFWCETPQIPGVNIQCNDDFDPVCAYHTASCTEEFCEGTTIINGCRACYQEGYDYYKPGECPIDVTEEFVEEHSDAVYCVLPDISGVNIQCEEIYNPVCAYYLTEDGKSHWRTVANGCQACYEYKYEYYIPGPCSENEMEFEEKFPISEEEAFIEEESVFDEEELKIYRCALPPYIDLGSIACSDLVRTVCAYKEDSNEDGQEYMNPCVACYKSRNDYYIYGNCPEVIKEEERGEEQVIEEIVFIEKEEEKTNEETVVIVEKEEEKETVEEVIIIVEEKQVEEKVEINYPDYSY